MRPSSSWISGGMLPRRLFAGNSSSLTTEVPKHFKPNAVAASSFVRSVSQMSGSSHPSFRIQLGPSVEKYRDAKAKLLRTKSLTKAISSVPLLVTLVSKTVSKLDTQTKASNWGEFLSSRFKALNGEASRRNSLTSVCLPFKVGSGVGEAVGGVVGETVG